MHIFKYSPREGTPAAKYKDQIKPQIKDARSKLIISIAEINEEKFKKSFLGRSMKVLYEHPFNKKDCFFEGFTDNYISVVSESQKDIKGKIIETELLELRDNYVAGRIKS
jgi:threonylcarbamoyladenosine tRNA methylthiotransferase MtaB